MGLFHAYIPVFPYDIMPVIIKLRGHGIQILTVGKYVSFWLT